MSAWLGKHLELKSGPITLPDGTVVGQHRGLPLYTIGQRHGFGRDLDQAKITKTLGSVQSLFVKEKNMATNTVVIAPANEPEALENKEFLVRDMHWISYACRFPWVGAAKFRYRQDDVKVSILPEGEKFRVICETPQRAITPGQYAVFYDKDVCLGCGVIE
jgi:tRNA-specific 2-thiouridylase